jgi:capsid portal protein
MANTFTFNTIERKDFAKTSYIETKAKSGDYINYGEDNLFPQTTVELFNNSSIHASCIKAVVDGIVGEGLTADEANEVYLKYANPNESWNDIFKKIALDYKLHGNFALEIIYSKDRKKIASVYHIDYSHVRCTEKDHRGNVPGYYISSKWGQKGYKKMSEEDYLYLPSFNPSLGAEEPSQLYTMDSYTPGQDYYPLPDYMGAYKVIKLDTEVDNFHISNITNGMVPSLAITTFNDYTEDEKRAINEQMKESYGGTRNAGKIVYMDVREKELAPTITPINTNGTDAYYTTINDLVVQKILTAHRITSPMLLGIKTEGQLGGRTEMVEAYNLFQNMVIGPMQKDILSCIERIVKFNAPEIVLGVEQKKLLEDGSTEEEVITDAETTVEEQVDIEDNINTQE